MNASAPISPAPATPKTAPKRILRVVHRSRTNRTALVVVTEPNRKTGPATKVSVYNLVSTRYTDESTTYAIDHVRSGFHGPEVDGGSYDATIASDPTKDTCSCPGFRRYKTCKHVQMLRIVFVSGIFGDRKEADNAK